MAYSFEQHEALDVAARRIASEELEQALRSLHATEGDHHEHVHDIRKGLKKLRSLLRLFRAELGEATFARENAACRQIGQRLSSARDVAATSESFAKLLQHYALPGEEFADFSRALEARRSEFGTSPVDEGSRAEIDEAVRLALARVSGWPLEHTSWKAVALGLRKAYSSGKRALDLAYREPSAEHFHEWRKRVKDHLYHLRLLAAIWPEPMKGQRVGVEELSEVLGDDHDLVELRRVLALELRVPDAARVERLLAFVDERQRTLREQARFLGARIYAERPRALEARLHRYYEAWRNEANLSLPGAQSNLSITA